MMGGYGHRPAHRVGGRSVRGGEGGGEGGGGGGHKGTTSREEGEGTSPRTPLLRNGLTAAGRSSRTSNNKGSSIDTSKTCGNTPTPSPSSLTPSSNNSAPRLPQINTSEGSNVSMSAVVYSGAVGAYIRMVSTKKSNKADSYANTSISQSTPNNPHTTHPTHPQRLKNPGGSGGGTVGHSGRSPTDPAVPTFHKSPNAAVPNPDPFQRPAPCHNTGIGGPRGGNGTSSRCVPTINGRGDRLHREGSHSKAWAVRNPAFGSDGPGGPMLSTVNRGSQQQHRSPVSCSDPSPLSNNSGFSDNTTSRLKTVSWSKYNTDLLQSPSQLQGFKPSPGGRLSPMVSPPKLQKGAVANNNTNMQVESKSQTFPVIEFRSYTKDPGATQHRTFTFNVEQKPHFPTSESSISPNSVVTTTESLNPPSDFSNEDILDFRPRKGSVSNELSPGFKQLLRTSTPKGHDEPIPETKIKRRKVEFRQESPQVCDMESKDPVIAISERLDLNRRPIEETHNMQQGRSPPKSILKKRDKSSHQPGEIKHMRKYQAALGHQNSFRLPRLASSQSNSSKGRNTNVNVGPNVNFNCSREFAAAFEDVDDG